VKALRVQPWHSRWLQFSHGEWLHRVSEIQWDDKDEKIVGDGAVVCGASGRLHMPGFMSRLGAKRCPRCCKAVKIPKGNGAPFNVLNGRFKTK
jgi:hypothetical protein